MKRVIFVLILLTIAITNITAQDTIIQKRTPFFKRVGHLIGGFVNDFSCIDSDYVEPQHYNFTVMMQNTNTYEIYKLRVGKDQTITFAPQPTMKIGPYFGWRWVFLGYTLDVNHLQNGYNKKEFDISLYSSQIGIDLFYRNTGDDYKIRQMYLGDNVDTKPIKDVSFNGLHSSIKGFNLYYIFNHKKFSYPAAFSQSTMQKKSRGSFIAGIGYTKHTLSIDWTKLNKLVEEKLGSQISQEQLDSTLLSGKIQYSDYSMSAGYGYNWAFAHNCLFAVSLSLALSYNRTTSETQHEVFSLRDFSIKNFNLDGVSRFGFVWNNNKWYAGTSAILHSYNYNKEQFSANNFFGSLNIYIGFNFNRRK